MIIAPAIHRFKKDLEFSNLSKPDDTWVNVIELLSAMKNLKELSSIPLDIPGSLSELYKRFGKYGRYFEVYYHASLGTLRPFRPRHSHIYDYREEIVYIPARWALDVLELVNKGFTKVVKKPKGIFRRQVLVGLRENDTQVLLV